MTSEYYVPATPEEQAALDADVAEAERGWSLEFLLAHAVKGRPLEVGTARAQTVAIRFDPVRLAALDKQAGISGKTRSQLVRDATDDYLARIAA